MSDIVLTPGKKAWTACSLFAAMLAFGALAMKPSWPGVLPILIFYVLLIINTYFSVKLFAEVIPDLPSQRAIDAILVVFYGVMAFSIGNAALFGFFLAVFFTIATMKYVLVLGIVSQPRLLKRKITADCLGILLGLAVVGGIMAGHETFSVWGLAIIFSVANVCMFFVWPLYRLDSFRSNPYTGN